MTLNDIIIQWVIFSLATLIVTIRRQLTVYHPVAIYLLFHLIVFCIRPTLIVLFDFGMPFEYMGLEPSTEILTKTLNLTSFALLLFVFSFSITCHKGGVHDFGPMPEITPRMRKSFVITASMLMPIAFYSIFGTQMIGERIGGVMVMRGTNGYLIDFQQVLIPLSIALIILFKWRWWTFLPFVIYAYSRASNGWGRWMIILPLIAIITFHCWQHRKNLPSFKFILLLPFILFVFNQLSHSRAYFRELMESLGTEDTLQERILEPELDPEIAFRDEWDTLDFANFDYLCFIVNHVPQSTGKFSYGVQHAQLFTEPIPRKLWSGKPVGPPIPYFDLNHYGNFIGLTPSVIGDGWMTFGWIGVSLNMILSGFLLGMFYNWFVESQSSIFKVCIFIIANSLLIQLFRDGSIVSIARFSLFTQFPILLWWLIHSWIFPIMEKQGFIRPAQTNTPATTPQ